MSSGKANFLDKLVAFIDPAKGADRLAHRIRERDLSGLAGGGPQNLGGYGFAYEGGEESRYRKNYAFNRSFLGTEDSAVNQYARDRLALEALDLYRNNEIVSAVVNRIATYSVWRGIRAIAKTTNADWNYLAELYFNERYFYSVDSRNREEISLADLQRWIVISSYLSGGLGFNMLENGQLQPVEYERLRTPQKHMLDASVRNGIKFNGAGHIDGFYICGRTKSGGVDTANWEYVPRANFIHTHAPFFRADQTIGIPRMAAVLSKLRDYDETDRYQLLKVKHDSMLLLKEKKAGGPGPRGTGGLPFASQVQSEDADGNQKRMERHDWGMIWRGSEEDDIQSFESRNPQPTWAPYLEHHLRVIAPAFDLPYEYLLMVFTAGSYTAQRSASMHARHTFLREHHRVNEQFNKRLWNWRIAKAMKEGDLPKAPIDPRSGVSEWYWAKWTTPDYGWLNPKEEALGRREIWNMGLNSMESMIDGDEDRDEVLKNKLSDIQQAQNMADLFNKRNKNAAPVTWRDFISTLQPGQTAPSNQTPPENAGANAED